MDYVYHYGREITNLVWRLGFRNGTLPNHMASKITFDTVRKIASGLPGVEESTSYGTPSLKIGGRLLTCMAINKSAEPNSLGVSIDLDQREALIAEAPDTYYVTDHYVNYPVVLVRLSRVNHDVLRDLLHAAWKFVSANKARKHRRLVYK